MIRDALLVAGAWDKGKLQRSAERSTDAESLGEMAPPRVRASATRGL
jgi:hypothetical protein